MTTCYILGAGFSRDYSTEIKSKIPNLKCPLDGDFFSMTKIYLEQNPNASTYFKPLLTFLRDFFTGHTDQTLKFLEEMPNMEEVFTLASLRDSENSDLIFTQMVELAALVIDSSITTEISQRQRKLATLVQEGDTVISFNYDVLIDRALSEKNLITDDSYRLNFHSVWDLSWNKTTKGSKVDLLKLHGSFNWLKCKNCGSLYLYKNSSQYAALIKERLGMIQPLSQNQCPHCNQRRLLPMITPPILAKEFDDSQISYVWQSAEKSLTKADNIVIIGYSLPPTDFFARLLFRKSRFNKTKNFNLTIVNPDKGSTNSFSAVFNPAKLEYFDSLSSFLD